MLPLLGETIDIRLIYSPPLASAYGVEVLWNPTDDDFEAKPAALFRRGVDFAEKGGCLWDYVFTFSTSEPDAASCPLTPERNERYDGRHSPLVRPARLDIPA